MSTIYFGNSVREWLIAALIAALVYLAVVLLRGVVIRRLGAWAARTDTEIDDAIVDVVKNTRQFFIVVVALAVAARGLSLGGFTPWVVGIVKLVSLAQLGIWIAAMITFMVKHALTRRNESGDRIGVAAVRAIGVTVKIITWIVLGVVALEFVFGRDVKTLLAGITVGGLALALAVQTILSDILAAIAIVFDRPFDVGDSIQIDNLSGTVEQIGLKTTRLRSVTGEQLVIGNAELLKSRLRNFKRMTERRVLLNLDVTYDTPPDVVERIPGIVKEIVSSQPHVRFERSHFAAFLESALRVETVYFVLDPSYVMMADIQQAVNLAVLRRFRAEHIDFAFPTHTVNVPASSTAAPAAIGAPSGSPATRTPPG